MAFVYLNPPPFSYQQRVTDPNDLKVSQWIKEWDHKESVEAGFIGVPLSRSSISASAASESPLCVRQSFRSFSTFDMDHEIDVSPLLIRDFGDIRMHTTDILKCHENIEKGMGEVYEAISSQDCFIPIILGGDHSITCPSVTAFSKAHPEKKIGLIQFDTHFDVRSLENGGPSNGTPIRGLITSGVIEGECIYQIGIHGFSNSKPYYDYIKEHGIHVYTMKKVREMGISKVIREILNQLHQKVDVIYVTVDIDVLDISFLPGSPGSAPGGMFSFELFEAVHQLGRERKVSAIDFVCLDPFRDVGTISVRTMTHTILSFLSGYTARIV